MTRSYQFGETRGDVLKQEKIESRLKMLRRSLTQKEEAFLSIEKSANSLECELIKLPRRKSCSVKTL